MSIFNFEDDDDFDRSGEPTFSLHDFKKWLSKQRRQEKLESKSFEIKENNENKESESKEEFKETFKERVRRRRKKD